MITVFDRQEFSGFYGSDSPEVYSGFEFRSCKFIGSTISPTIDVRLRSTFRDIVLKNCEVLGCAVGTAILDEIQVEGLKTSQLFQTWGAVFRHVTLRGKVGRMMISQMVAPRLATKAQQQAAEAENQQFYREVDWALDISRVECQELEIQGVPAKLIRRDSETQVIVTRESARKGDWKHLDLSATWWAVSLKLFLDRGDKDIVLVAPKRHKKFKQLLQGLNLLRETGVAGSG